jgi:anti-anti-sigma factor
VCVVVVDGEVDMLTAPQLEACAREQLTAAPIHLILDLEPVRFMGSSGLSCLLRVRELTQQTGRVHLHLAGLATRAVAHPLKVLGLREYFHTYPHLTDALTSLTKSPETGSAPSR